MRQTQVPQNAAPVLSDGRKSGPQHGKGIPRQIAEETGLSVDTVRRARSEVQSTLNAAVESKRLKGAHKGGDYRTTQGCSVRSMTIWPL